MRPPMDVGAFPDLQRHLNLGMRELMMLSQVTSLWVTSVWVTSLFQCTAAQLSITPDVVTAVVGDTVTLSVRYKGRLEYVVWFRGGRPSRDDVIIALVDSPHPFYGHQSTGRETLLPDGSLQITDVQTYHSGNYTVTMNVGHGGRQKVTAQLRVQGAPPASDASCSTWWVTLAVASGMLLGAVVAVLGVVLFYERHAKKANGATPGGSRRAINEPAVNYVNVENANQAQPAALSPDADHTYMCVEAHAVDNSMADEAAKSAFATCSVAAVTRHMTKIDNDIITAVTATKDGTSFPEGFPTKYCYNLSPEQIPFATILTVGDRLIPKENSGLSLIIAAHKGMASVHAGVSVSLVQQH
ncbi:uncharacterized protein LOC144768895 [Lissotriton helveticus]